MKTDKQDVLKALENLKNMLAGLRNSDKSLVEMVKDQGDENDLFIVNSIQRYLETKHKRADKDITLQGVLLIGKISAGSFAALLGSRADAIKSLVAAMADDEDMRAIVLDAVNVFKKMDEKSEKDENGEYPICPNCGRRHPIEA